MSEKRSITVQIYGNEYTLKGEADPAYIAELAKFVDTKMAEIGKKSSAPAAKVAILAAMNIADEFHRLEKAKAENLKLIDTLEKNVIEMKRSSDGSLRHTLELKEQLYRHKAEAAEKGRQAEELGKTKSALEGALKKLTLMEPELARAQETAAALKTQAYKIQQMLDAKNASTDESVREINELKINLGETKAELGKAKEDQEKIKTQLESAQKELELVKKTESQSGKDAEQLLEELEKTQNNLKFTQSEMEKLKKAAESTPTNLKDETRPSPSAFFPPPEKVQALLKKIDAILE